MESDSGFQKVQELNAAIRSKNYDKVQEMLADHQVPLNSVLSEVPWNSSRTEKPQLPLVAMLGQRDLRLARLFLECPRDWLSSEFHYISDDFISSCAEEATLIYEKMIGKLGTGADERTRDALLLETCRKVRDNELNTILHLSGNVEVMQIALELGADIEAENKKGETPVISSGRSGGVSVQKFLFEKGANLKHVSRTKTTAFNQCGDIERFFKEIGLTEELFKIGYFRDIRSNRPVLEIILEKYPQYKKTFEQNVPFFLADLPNSYDSPYFKKFTEEQFMLYAKTKFRTGNCWGMETALHRKKNFAIKNADELLHEAVKADGIFSCMDVVRNLLRRYRADPSGIVNGKTPVFCARNSWVFKLLLDEGADLFQKCDGYEFFERDDVLDDSRNYFLYDLIKFHRRGVDLFRPGEKTGKSLIQHLDQSRMISCNSQFEIPVSKFTRAFFEAYTKKSTYKIAPIDDEGNTLAHFAALHFSKNKFEHLMKEIFESVKLGYWKKYVNKAGKSPYDLVLESKKYFEFVDYLKDFKDQKQFCSDCSVKYGESFLQDHGARLLFLALSKEDIKLASYLHDEKGVALNCSIWKIDSEMYRSIEVVRFFIARKVLPFGVFGSFFKHSQIEMMTAVLNEMEDLKPYVEWFCERFEALTSADEFSQSVMLFLQHERVFQLIDTMLLDRKYFRLARSARKIGQLRQIGIDARKLIGSGERPVLPTCWTRTGSILRNFQEAGWFYEDFVDLGVLEDFQSHCPNFSTFFKKGNFTLFSKLKPEEILGDQQKCGICKDAFEQRDKVELLSCKHLFHHSCVASYLEQTRKCPYCMNPHKKAKI